MKKIVRITAVLFALLMLLSVPASAAASYQTYVYSQTGQPLYTPDAYTPTTLVNSDYMRLETPISEPRDIVVDKAQNVYISDSKTNRVVILDKYYRVKTEISEFVNQYGVADSLDEPHGMFVSERLVVAKDANGNSLVDQDGNLVRVEEKLLYVCDTGSSRIVVFDENGNFVRIIPQPNDQLFGEDSVYTPIAIAVDDYGRLYVVSDSTTQGIIMMKADGEFTGFIGAQKVSLSLGEIIIRMFRTEAQKAASELEIPTEFNNIDINDDGFVYATISSLSEGDMTSAIKNKSKSGDYAPVKMLNGAGEEIMRRNGFYPPSGEILFYTNANAGSITGPSKIVDVAVGPEKTWSVIDEKRSKIFTYDFNGNLLFAFGDKGTQLGNISAIQAICYQGDNILILDKTDKSFTVFTRTEYGNTLIRALEHENTRQYHLAKQDWEEVLKRNSNFDEAYIGIGKALFNDGKYEESLEYYKAAYDTVNYSKSYAEIRKEWVSKYVLLIPVVVVAICLAYTYFFKWAAKINNRAALDGKERKTFLEELLYGFHLIFHPFDGFWDLKHEKRGSVRAAIVYLGVTILAFFYQAIGSAYLVNPQGTFTTIWAQILGVLVPLLLWVIANWCLTTLFEGEGSIKDIFIASCYSLLPLIMILIPSTLATNIVVLSELNIINLLTSFAFIWVGLLLFCGMMVTHDYGVGKNILTCAATIVGMAFIMFIGILFSTLLSSIVGFISGIVVEINYRL